MRVIIIIVIIIIIIDFISGNKAHKNSRTITKKCLDYHAAITTVKITLHVVDVHSISHFILDVLFDLEC